MNNNRQEIKQNICKKMTNLQADIESALNQIIEQSGSQINYQQRQEYNQAIAKTKQVIERFQVQYGCSVLFKGNKTKQKKSAIAVINSRSLNE